MILLQQRGRESHSKTIMKKIPSEIPFGVDQLPVFKFHGVSGCKMREANVKDRRLFESDNLKASYTKPISQDRIANRVNTLRSNKKQQFTKKKVRRRRQRNQSGPP